MRQRERCSGVDRDREGVGGGTEERQVFELAANPQILEDFWDNASFSLGWLIYDQQELGHTGAEHMRQLCGLELLGAMAGSPHKNRLVSISEGGGMTSLMGTHGVEDLAGLWIAPTFNWEPHKKFYSKDLPPSLPLSLSPFLLSSLSFSLLPPSILPTLPPSFFGDLLCI